jgi:parallel beta-helix repeat protein
LITGNTIEDNWWAGIFYDRSPDLTATGNTITGNGFKADAGDKFYHGAVQVTGPGATVTHNIISGNHNAIVVIGYGLDGKGLTADGTTIKNNTITNSGNTGIVTNGSASVFSTSEIDDNDYRYNDIAARHWVWNTGGELGWDGWRGVPNDPNGSLATP